MNTVECIENAYLVIEDGVIAEFGACSGGEVPGITDSGTESLPLRGPLPFTTATGGHGFRKGSPALFVFNRYQYPKISSRERTLTGPSVLRYFVSRSLISPRIP